MRFVCPPESRQHCNQPHYPVRYCLLPASLHQKRSRCFLRLTHHQRSEVTLCYLPRLRFSQSKKRHCNHKIGLQPIALSLTTNFLCVNSLLPAACFQAGSKPIAAKLNVQNAELWSAVSTMLVMLFVDRYCR